MNKLSTTTTAFVSALRVFVSDRVRSERGATAVEYGLLVALIAIVIIAAVVLLGTNLSGVFNNAEGDLTNAV